MEYLITVLCFFLSIFVAVLAFLDTRIWKTYQRENKLKETDGNYIRFLSKTIIKEFTNLVKHINRRTWILLILFSCVACSSIYVILGNEYEVTLKIRLLVLTFCMLSIGIIDWYTKRIPNVIVLFLLITRIVMIVPEYFVYNEHVKTYLIASAVGFIVSFLFMLAISLMTKGGLGMGDVKILSCIGFMVDLELAFYSLLFGLIMCMFYSIYLIFLKHKNKKSTVPFGPFIYMGFAMATMLKMF